MKTIAVSEHEGEDWQDWHPFEWNGRSKLFSAVHAIKFDNGAIWDAVNGWRRLPRVRVKMGRAVV